MSERKEWLPSELAQAEDLAVSMAKQVQELTAQRDALLTALERVVIESTKPSDPDAEHWDHDIHKSWHWVQEALAKARGGER